MQSAEASPASAHLFIVNPLRLGGVDGLFRTHPPTESRIEALLELEGSGLRRSAGAARGVGRAPGANLTLTSLP